MADDAAEIRDVDPAERYYWLFDVVSPMSVVAYAELNRPLDRAALAAALAAVQARHPLLRLRLEATDGGLHLAPAEGAIPIEERELEQSQWQSVVESELDRRLVPSVGPCARAICVVTPDGSRSMLILVTHHALSDGRSAMSLLQEVVRIIATGPAALGPAYDVPAALHDRYPAELRSARATVETVRAMQAEREGLAQPVRFDFGPVMPDGRRTRITQLVLDGEQLAAIRSKAKADGASLYGVVAAAVLQSAAELVDADTEPVVSLATPTDLRARASVPTPPDELVLAIGLLSSPYPITPGDGAALATRITTQLQREVDRGDSHLFYRLARAGAFHTDADGLAAFESWLATTPHNVAVSNIGLIDHTDDPEWLTSIAALLSTGPNQLGFVVLSTYRGQLSVYVLVDEAKLPQGHRERLIAGIVTRTSAIRLDEAAVLDGD
jgi:hypothetical protein